MADEVKDLTAKKENEVSIFDLGNTPTMEELLQDAEGLQLEFNQIKIPSSGSTVFELENMISGETDPKKELKCVILAAVPTNVYFAEAFSGESVPPDCSSRGGKIGVDKDGEQHDCSECSLNQFGSGVNGGKACQNRVTLYVLLENETTPRMISLPPSAIPKFNSYRSILFLKKIRSIQVLTSIKLEKTTNKNGIAYSVPTFAVAGYTKDLSPDAQNVITDALALLKCMQIL